MAVAGEGDDPRILHAKQHITDDNYIEKMESPRFFFTHLRQEFLPKELDKQKPRDLKGNVKNVAKFLGKDLNDSVIDKIADLCSIEKMKQISNARSDATCRMMHIDPEDSPFVRRGKVGGWKEYFTVVQSEILDQTYSKWMEGTDLQLEFE
ncbi:sulfotransferase 1C2-like [Glandiceps talaboti]